MTWSVGGRTTKVRSTCRVLAALGALIVAVALPGSAVAAPSWLAETDLSAPGAHAYQPQVAIDPGGDAVAVWSREEEEYSRYVVQAAGRPAGGAWGTPVDLSATGLYGEYAQDPQVAVDQAGDAVAIWEDGESAIRGATRTAGGEWQAPVELTVGGGDAYDPGVAVDRAGDAVAVWRRGSGSDWHIQAASRPAGGTWGAPVDLSVTGADVDEPLVAVDDAGDAVVIWRERDGSDYVIGAASRPAGGAWSAPVTVSAAGGNAAEARLAVGPGGDAVAVWDHPDGPDYVVQAASRPAGGAWGPPLDLSATGGNANQPRVAVGSGGAATVVWGYNGASGVVVQAAGRPAGGAWGAPVDLSGMGLDPEGATVGVDPGGDAVALWEVYDGSEWLIQGAGRPAGAGVWGAPVNLAGVGAGGATPAIAVDEAGDAAAVWRRFDGSVHIIQAAGYDAAGPQLRSLSIPATGTVGQPLTFSVSPLDVWSSPAALDWSFGDGAAAVGTPVTHTYTAPGTYTVDIGAADAFGNRSGASGTVTITAPAAAGNVGSSTTPTTTGRSTRGQARVAGLAWVRHGRVLLRMSCPGPGRCTGVADLSVAPRSTKRRERGPAASLKIGKSRFDIGPGEKKTMPVKLTKKGRSRLQAAGSEALEAHLTGTGVISRAVVLRAAGHRHRR